MQRTALKPEDTKNAGITYGESSLLRFFRWLPFFDQRIRAYGAQKILDTENTLLGEGATYEVWTAYASQVERRSPSWQVDSYRADDQWRLVAVKKAKFTISQADARKQGDPVLENGFDVVLRELIIGCHFVEHPNIVSPLALGLGITENQVRPYSVVEYAELGTLRSYLLKQRISPSEARGLCADVAQGLRALHMAGIIHGDVKAENSLVFRCHLPGRTAVAKLADFGASIVDLPDLPVFPYLGTPVLNAPEVRKEGFGRETHDPDNEGHRLLQMQCDTYSFGLLIWEVVLGGHRFLESPSFRGVSFTEEDALQYLNTFNSSHLRARFGQDISGLLELESNPSYKDDLRILFKAANACLRDEPHLRLPMESLAVMLEDAVSAEITSEYEWDGTDIREYFPTFDSCGYLQEIVATETKEAAPALPWKIQTDIVEGLKQAVDHPNLEARASAAYDLAFCYLCGFGVVENPSQSLHYITIAAEHLDDLLFIWTTFYATLGHSLHANDHTGSVHDLLERGTPFRDTDNGAPFAQAFRVFIQGIMQTHRKCKYLLLQGGEIVIEEIRLSSSGEEIYKFISEAGTEASGALVVPFEDKDPNISAIPFASFMIAAGLDQGLYLMLNNGLNVNELDENGETLLLQTMQTSNFQLSKLLIDRGADVALADSMGVTPAHCLIYFDMAEAIHLAEIFRKTGVDFNAQSKPMYVEALMTRLVGSPLHWAISMGYTELIRHLLEPQYNIDINARYLFPYNSIIHTPLSLATALNLAEITALLLRRGASHLSGPYPPASHYLLGAPVWVRWLHHGSRHRAAFVDTVQAYVSHTNNQVWQQLDDVGFCPLVRAVYNIQTNHDDYAIEELIRAGANLHTVTESGANALHWLVYGHRNNAQQSKLFIMLVDQSIDLNCRAGPDGDTALHYAARFNTLAILAYLLIDKGLEVNTRNNRAWTPLHTAVFYDSDIAICTLLLEHGADPDAVEKDGRTPLGLAIDTSVSNLAVLQILLDSNCSLVVDVEQSLSSLQFAIMTPQISPSRRRDFVGFLVRHQRVQGDLDYQMPGTGWTALHLAAQKAELPMVRLLVEADADPRVVDGDGRTALDLARVVRMNPQGEVGEASVYESGIDKVIEYLELEMGG